MWPGPWRPRAAEGFEGQVGANYLGHFALEGLLFQYCSLSRRVASLRLLEAC